MPSVQNLLKFGVEVSDNGTANILYCLIEHARRLLRSLQDCEARATFFRTFASCGRSTRTIKRA